MHFPSLTWTCGFSRQRTAPATVELRFFRQHAVPTENSIRPRRAPFRSEFPAQLAPIEQGLSAIDMPDEPCAASRSSFGHTAGVYRWCRPAYHGHLRSPRVSVVQAARPWRGLSLLSWR